MRLLDRVAGAVGACVVVAAAAHAFGAVSICVSSVSGAPKQLNCVTTLCEAGGSCAPQSRVMIWWPFGIAVSYEACGCPGQPEDACCHICLVTSEPFVGTTFPSGACQTAPLNCYDDASCVIQTNAGVSIGICD